jgi:hypothetical protein
MSAAGPGIGDGWSRLADALKTAGSVAEIDAIWVFRTIRREAKDFGTAIISRIEGDRRRISTARWSLAVKGKARGKFEYEVLDVATGPIETLDELLALVPKRAEDEEPPIAIPVATWFPPESAEESVARAG